MIETLYPRTDTFPTTEGERAGQKCGLSAASDPLSQARQGPVHAAGAWSKIFDHDVLTFAGVEAYITRIRRAVRVTARWRASEAPHF